MSEVASFYSRPILEAIGDGILYSDLLCDKELIGRHGEVHHFTDAIVDLVDLKAIKMDPRWSPEEGDDHWITLTKRGEFLRRYTDD